MVSSVKHAVAGFVAIGMLVSSAAAAVGQMKGQLAGTPSATPLARLYLAPPLSSQDRTSLASGAA